MSEPNKHHSDASHDESEHSTHHSSHSSDSAHHSSHSSSSHHSSGSSSHRSSDSSSHRSSDSSSHRSSDSSSHRSSDSASAHSGSTSHSSSSHSGEQSSRRSSGSESHSSHHGSGSHHSIESERRSELIQKYQVVSDDSIPTAQESGHKRHHHHRHHHRFSRRRRIRRAIIILVSIPLALVLIAASVFGVLNLIGSKQLQKDVGGVETNPFSVTYDEGKTVEYNGVTYTLNENIVTVAAIGIDREAFGLEDDKIGTAGQADFILIAALDLKSGLVSPILIPRDTLVDVDQYTTDGQYVGVDRMQICLSFAYGDGAGTSSRNVLTSAQRVLYGIPVHLYGVLDLDGIPALNDAIGGVSVTLPEDFKGKSAGQRIMLQGMDAESFVRSRDTERMDSDTPRRARQIAYLNAYVSKVTSAAIRDFGIIRNLYTTAMDYAFTNISLSRLTYMGTTLLSKGLNIADVTTLAGKLQPGDPYAEYILDEQAAFETVLHVFYTAAVS